MNCIAIDDEPLALNVIKDFCSRIDFLNLMSVFTNPVDAIKVLNEQKIELIFIDIQMPHITGLEFIKALTNPPLVIFTTAYSEHALEGFELDAIDYLVKPIPFDRFLKAASKAYIYNNLIQQGHQNTKQDLEYMLIKVEYSTQKVVFSNIQYIEGLKDYVKIIIDGKQILTKSSLKKMEEKLPSDQFLRVHKSYIVSISKIEKIENNRIVFGDKRIPIGDHYKEEFNKRIERFKL